MTNRLRDVLYSEIFSALTVLNEMSDWGSIECEAVVTINEICKLLQDAEPGHHYNLTLHVYSENKPGYVVKVTDNQNNIINHFATY